MTAFASFFLFIVLNVSKLTFPGGNLYDEVESCLSFLHCTQNPIILLFDSLSLFFISFSILPVF